MAVTIAVVLAVLHTKHPADEVSAKNPNAYLGSVMLKAICVELSSSFCNLKEEKKGAKNYCTSAVRPPAQK